MLISWNWLKSLVRIDVSADELAERLMMAGLNHESTTPVSDDLAIDLEVTSNRPDCLGHLGIAREASVVFGAALELPAANPVAKGAAIQTSATVQVDCPRWCPRYTARLLRGVRVAPSPAWLQRRLTTLGIATINNVVDVTNYVLMECGQPLHAFDFAKLAGGQIVVRAPQAGEKLEAIDHKTYELSSDMCVIADRDRAVGIAGIMGGAGTEVTGSTCDVLLEAAEFDPTVIRTAARRLNLHSDSSYRFERGVDPHGVDWASRRACQLILELAGGELAAGVIDVGRLPPERSAVRLRWAQIARVLGIEIPEPRVRQLLLALGCQPTAAQPSAVIEVVPPSWRADLTREIDLIEEVARLHGYDQIPENVRVPMATSSRSRADRVLGRVRQGLTALGFDEAFTLSVVDRDWSALGSAWTEAAPLETLTPVLRGANQLRRSLVPSLLSARRTNETLGNETIELFETAKVYLPSTGDLPSEEPLVALCSGGDFLLVKGVVETLVELLNPALRLTIEPCELEFLKAGRRAWIKIDGEPLGYLGEAAPATLKMFDLRGATTVAELKLAVLMARAELTPVYRKLSAYPAIARDLNLVVDEALTWSELAEVVREQAGPLLQNLSYQDTYRDPERLGTGKKSLLFSLTWRDSEATLTNQQADELRQRIVDACTTRFGAALRS